MSDIRWQRSRRPYREPETASVSPLKPPPIILGLARPAGTPAVHDADQEFGHSSDSGAGLSGMATHSQSDTLLTTADPQLRSGGDKPIVVLRSRDDSRNLAASPSSGAAGETTQSHIGLSPQPGHQIHAATHMTAQPRLSISSQTAVDAAKNKLAAPPEMKESIKIIDDNLRWIDAGIDWLVDQTDYLVVGIVGPQGSGKSTVLSLLAGNSAQDAYRNYIFQPQTKDIKEDAFYQTAGVDMVVSPERIIFLDTQPIFSSAFLDTIIRTEKKLSPEYSSPENFVEMQSLQIASFLMTVCHVIIVTQDWFADLTFLRSLLTAEMLKPQTHPTSSTTDNVQSATLQDDAQEFYPTLVFVLNKVQQDDFTAATYSDMKLVLHSIFSNSKLRYRGAVSMHRDNVITTALGKEREGSEADVNLFLLPTMEFYKNEPESILQAVPEYRGFPSFNFMLRSMRNQLYSIARAPITPAPLSERNWFNFAARTWEAVKKSPLFAEYNRLLP